MLGVKVRLRSSALVVRFLDVFEETIWLGFSILDQCVVKFSLSSIDKMSMWFVTIFRSLVRGVYCMFPWKRAGWRSGKWRPRDSQGGLWISMEVYSTIWMKIGRTALKKIRAWFLKTLNDLCSIGGFVSALIDTARNLVFPMFFSINPWKRFPLKRHDHRHLPQLRIILISLLFVFALSPALQLAKSFSVNIC